MRIFACLCMSVCAMNVVHQKCKKPIELAPQMVHAYASIYACYYRAIISIWLAIYLDKKDSKENYIGVPTV